MIRNKLRVLLADRRISMSELAKMTNLHYTTINRFEKEGQQRLNMKAMDAVCEALEIQPGDILEHVPG